MITMLMSEIVLNFTTLTPIHIGTGECLIYGLDYFIEGNELCAFNRNKLLVDNNLDLNKLTTQEVKEVRERFLNDRELLNRYKVYGLECTSKFLDHIRKEVTGRSSDGSVKEIAKVEVNEFSNQSGRFYVPASSVKGALLTVLGVDSLGIDTRKRDKQSRFIIRDSNLLDNNALKVETFYRNGMPSYFVVLKGGEDFSIVIKRKGLLRRDQLKEKLSAYYEKQINLAINGIGKISGLKEETNFLKSLRYVKEVKDSFSSEEYLINLGFGGSGWFKVGMGNSSKARSGKYKGKVAHTGYTYKEGVNNDGRIGLGWCKLKLV